MVRSFIFTSAVLGCIFSQAALAQTARSSTALPAGDSGYGTANAAPGVTSAPPSNVIPDGAGPIVNGRHLQPHGPPSSIGTREADHVLRQGSVSPATRTPPVVPKDLYGQPLGPSPGLAPPDPDPHVEPAQH